MPPVLDIDPMKLLVSLAETKDWPTLVGAFQRLHEVSEQYLKQLEEQDLAEDCMMNTMWASKEARNAVLTVIDNEVAMGDQSDRVGELQSILDGLNSYVRDQLKMEYEDEQAHQSAMQTYQDEGMATADEAGALQELPEAAPLNAAMRRRHATVVRSKKDGGKEYKFPIPDKAHARAALARLDQSDLTPAEKAKVKARAYRVLGTSPSKKVKEADHVEDPISEAVDATIGGMDELELLTLTEAKLDLASGELVATFIKPGLNRSGARFYPKETIKEAVDQGMFNGLKMYLNHASPQELAQRPERSLVDWVSTIKETWVDSETGAGKAKIKVVQGWFKSFLKDLQESGALEEIGLSIFAQGKVKAERREGKMTNVVEQFRRAMSVDWVTEPGAGGRVDAIWESYQPQMQKEQELNMLNSMKVDEALKELRESRPDVLKALVDEIQENQQTEEQIREAQAHTKSLEDKVLELTSKLEEKDKESEAEVAARLKAEQTALVAESLASAQLPQLAKDRILRNLSEVVVKEDGKTLDDAKIKESIVSAVKAEEDYMAEILKAAKTGGKGITGLGESAGGDEALQESGPKSVHDKVNADIAKRFGHVETPAS
jgi:hypothetical protein